MERGTHTQVQPESALNNHGAGMQGATVMQTTTKNDDTKHMHKTSIFSFTLVK